MSYWDDDWDDDDWIDSDDFSYDDAGDGVISEYASEEDVNAPSVAQFRDIDGFTSKRSDSMSNVNVGQVFKTQNATVQTLPVGTLLEVVGQGQLRVGVASLPKGGNGLDNGQDNDLNEAFDPQPGDRIFIPTKNRYGTVVRAGSNVDSGGHDFLYISDDEPVVRGIGDDVAQAL